MKNLKEVNFRLKRINTVYSFTSLEPNKPRMLYYLVIKKNADMLVAMYRMIIVICLFLQLILPQGMNCT